MTKKKLFRFVADEDLNADDAIYIRAKNLTCAIKIFEKTNYKLEEDNPNNKMIRKIEERINNTTDGWKTVGLPNYYGH